MGAACCCCCCCCCCGFRAADEVLSDAIAGRVGFLLMTVAGAEIRQEERAAERPFSVDGRGSEGGILWTCSMLFDELLCLILPLGQNWWPPLTRELGFKGS